MNRLTSFVEHRHKHVCVLLLDKIAKSHLYVLQLLMDYTVTHVMAGFDIGIKGELINCLNE